MKKKQFTLFYEDFAHWKNFDFSESWQDVISNYATRHNCTLDFNHGVERTSIIINANSDKDISLMLVDIGYAFGRYDSGY